MTITLRAVKGSALTHAEMDENFQHLAGHDVTRYGAVGDGVTDDTGAFQDAIDAALGGNGIVRIRAGTYNLPSTTSLDPGAGGLTFIGDGKEQTILQFSEGTSGAMKYLFKNITDTAKGGLRFEGICFEGTLPATAQRAGNPLWLDYYSNVEVENCRFYNIGGEAMDFHYCGRFYAANNEFENLAADGVRVRDTNDIVVIGNKFKRTGDDPIALHTNSATVDTFRPIRSRMVVSGNTLVNCNGSIKVIGARLINVSNNILDLSHSYGIIFNSGAGGAEGENPAHDILVTNNIIANMVSVRSGSPASATAAIGVGVLAGAGGTLTEGVIPGDYDSVSGLIIKPWDWYEADNSNSTDGIPRHPRLVITGNTISRTRKAVAAFSDFGEGSALWQGVAYDPAMTDTVIGGSHGIYLGTVPSFVSFDISRNVIENVRDTGIVLPAPATDRDYQACSIKGNKIFDVRNKGIHVTSGAFNVDLIIEGNEINCDPFRQNSNSNIDGSYDADSTPRGIDTDACRGISILRNKFQNCCRAIYTTVATSIVVNENVAVATAPAATGFNTGNKGIGAIMTGDRWEYIIADSDPTSGTYRAFSQKMLRYSAAMPSSGWYYAGWVVESTSGGFHGWIRLTTGTGHVLNTDWAIIPSHSAVRILGSSGLAVANTGDTNENTVATISVPGGAMGPNGFIRIISLWSTTANTNTKTMRTKFNGTTYTTLSHTAGTATSGQVMTIINNRNSLSSQVGGQSVFSGLGGSITAGVTTSAHATAGDLNITLTAQCAVGSDTITLERYTVEVCYAA